MQSLVPRALGRRVALTCFAAAALPGSMIAASAAPAPAPQEGDVVVLTREDARLTARLGRLEDRLDGQRAALAAARGRLDEARRDHEEALGAVQRRLVTLYKSRGGDLDPTAALLTGGPQDVTAVVALRRAVDRADGRALARLRLSVRRLDEAEAEVSARKGALAGAVEEVEVQRVALRHRIDAATAAAAADPETVPVAPEPAPF
ncbi:MAG: hypothetical protein AB1416_13970, partial [Actinomycetota bacterium]